MICLTEHAAEYEAYCRSIEYPLQALENTERRGRIARSILEMQETAMLGAAQDLERLLDGLLEMRASGRKLYKQFKMKTGEKVRDLAVPQEPLNTLLKEYVLPLIKKMPCHPSAHGGEKGWSAKKSVQTHIPIRAALSFDITYAFGNTGVQYVFNQYYCFLLSSLESSDAALDTAGFLTQMSVAYYAKQEHYALPQGSPISMTLFNRILRPVDVEIAGFCGEKGLRHSRWVDDIIISSQDERCGQEDLIGAVKLLDGYFPVHPEKIYFQHNPGPIYLLGQEITGRNLRKVNKEEFREKVRPSRVTLQEIGEGW